MASSFTNVLSPSDIAYIQQLPEVVEAKSRVDATNSGMINCTITLTDSIRSALATRFGLDLTTVHTIPMRWVKGDTAPHVDVGSARFDHTHLVYLSDSAGALVIDGAEYPIQENTGYIFAEGVSHATCNTGATPRLVLGPMSNQAFRVGNIKIEYYSGYPINYPDNYLASNNETYVLGDVTTGSIGSYNRWIVDPNNSIGIFVLGQEYDNEHVFSAIDGNGVSAYYAVYAVQDVNWVAVGAGTSSEKTIQWSTDGRVWNDASSGGFTGRFGFQGYGVAYGNGAGVAVGEGSSPKNRILWSDDGRTWQDASSGGFGNIDGRAIAYGNGEWVAVGSGSSPENSILWSPDGRTWHDASSGGFGGGGTYSSGYGIAYDGNNWVAVGRGSSPEKRIQWSPDGKTWHDASSGGFTSYGNGIAYGNGEWVAVGGGSPPEKTIQWSDDGRTWLDASSGGFDISDTGYGIAYDNGVWVAVGGGSTPKKSILWSDDGRIWHDASSGGFTSYGYGIAYDGNNWVAVGSGSSPEKRILWSPDGRRWQDASSGGFVGNCGRGVATRQAPPTPTTTTTTLPDPTTTTTTLPSPLPCFVSGTRILTPTGYKKVEEIETGDNIITSDSRNVKVSMYRFTIASTTAETAPYTIQAGALGNYLPSRDLHISGNHAIQDSTGVWQIPKFLANKNPQIQQHALGESVTYYHVACENYYKDNLIAEGVTAESYNERRQPVVWKRSASGYVRRQKDDLHVRMHLR